MDTTTTTATATASTTPNRAARRRVAKLAAGALAALAGAGALGAHSVGQATAFDEYCNDVGKITKLANGHWTQYTKCGLPDLDQGRQDLGQGIDAAGNSHIVLGLTQDGKNHCAPTAVMDVFTYIATHGYGQLRPGNRDFSASGPNTDWGRYNDMSQAIRDLGYYMKTDPYKKGTFDDNLNLGARRWLQDVGLQDTFDISFVSTEKGGTPTAAAQEAINTGAFILPNLGWYKQVTTAVGASASGDNGSPVPGADNKTGWFKTGGHVVVLSKADLTTAKAGGTIEIRDPGDGGSLTDQSAYRSVSLTVRDNVTFPTWTNDGSMWTGYDQWAQKTEVTGTGGKAAWLGYTKIVPKVALFAHQGKLSFSSMIASSATALAPKITSVAVSGTVASAALSRDGMAAVYATEGSSSVYLASRATASSELLASFEEPVDEVLNGPDDRIWVRAGSRLVSLSLDGSVVASQDLPADTDDVARDPATDELVTVSSEDGTVTRFDGELADDTPTTTDLPEQVEEALAGEEDVSLAIDPASGDLVLHEEGSEELVRVDPETGTTETAEAPEGAGDEPIVNESGVVEDQDAGVRGTLLALADGDFTLGVVPSEGPDHDV